MRIRDTLFALFFGLAIAACGDTEGIQCDRADDCDDGQICAHIAACVSEPCPGICGVPCDGPADCGADQLCAETAGSGGRICQSSRTITE